MADILSDADVGLGGDVLSDADVGLEFKDLSADMPLNLASPRMPLRPEELTTFGGPPKQLASMRETLAEPMEDLFRPRIQGPPVPLPSEVPTTLFEKAIFRPTLMGQLLGDDLSATVARQSLNAAKGAGEFMTSPVGLGAVVAGAVAPTATAIGFTLDMAKNLGNQGVDLWNKWDSLTPEQRAASLTDMGATGAMLLASGAHAKNRLRTIADEGKATPISEAPKDAPKEEPAPTPVTPTEKPPTIATEAPTTSLEVPAEPIKTDYEKLKEARREYYNANAEWTDPSDKVARKRVEDAYKKFKSAQTEEAQAQRQGAVTTEPTLAQVTEPLPQAEPPVAPLAEEGVSGAAPSPSGMTTAPSPTVPATPKAISEVIRDLSKGLGVPMRFGRLTTSKFGGYFKPKQNLIGAKYANDMPIIGHEAGHKLDTTFGLSSDPAVMAELDILGNPATAGSMSSWTPSKSVKYRLGEGVAEFVRYWLVDPAHAARVAPTMDRAFNTALDSNPDFGRVMRQARDDIQLWRNAEPEARLQSSISSSDPNGARYGLSDLTRDVVDDLHYLRLAVDDAQKLSSTTLPATKNPYLNARLLRGSYGMADTFIRKGIVDFKDKSVQLGTSLEDVLKPVSGRVDEFRRWIVAKQAQELHAQGKETGLLPSDVNAVVNKYNSDPTFNAAFDGFKKWNDALLQYAVDGGLISQKGADTMRAMNNDYVPFHRVFEIGAGESPSMESIGTGRGLNVGKPGSIRGRKGSRRDIVDPLETVIKNAYAIITATEKNNISTGLADMLEMPGMAKWGDRVRAPMQAVKVDVGRMRDQLEALGADLSKVSDDDVIKFFKQSGQPAFGENIIKVNRGGEPEYYRLKKELFDTFHALDMDAGGTFLRLISQPAQWLRAGVTLTPDFATFNALRDTVSSAVLSRYGSLPFQSTLQGLSALLKNPQLVSEWAASGGKSAVEASFFDRAKLQKFLADKIIKDPSLGQEMAMWAKSPMTALRYFTGLLEEGTRVGEYQTVYNKLIKDGMATGEARRMAAFEARDLQDFAKGGSKTKPIRMMTAFWNAQLQANVRLANAFKNKPKETILKGLAFITVPKLIEQSINWDDPDYWDRPQWERDLFFLLPYGKDANGHTKFFRVPTPFEIGLIFGSFPGRLLEWAKKNDPKAAKEFPEAMARQSIPFQMIPQFVTTMMELNAGPQGYSYYRGRPIVPASLANKPPEMQFTTQNSLTSRKLGELLKMSPAKIDYAINSMAGGLGKQAVHQIADRAISAVTGEERTAQSVTPFGRFVATPAGVQSQAVEDFYEALGKAEQDSERAKAGMASTGEKNNLKMLREKAQELSDFRKKMRAEKNETKRNELAHQMSLKAKRALDTINKKK